MFDPLVRMAIIALGDTLFFAVSDVLCVIYLHRTYGDIGSKKLAASILQGLTLGIIGTAVGLVILIGLNAIAPYAGNILLNLLYIIIAGSAAVAASFGVAIYRTVDAVQPLANILERILGKLKRR